VWSVSIRRAVEKAVRLTRGFNRRSRSLLVSPQFLFRFELDPENAAPGTIYRISDLELASRLSFFIWSSIPDDSYWTWRFKASSRILRF